MKISVIVPVYNVEKYLHQCIESIVNQSFANLEIILVDDGSTDNSLQLCKDASEKDSRILLIAQENAGVSSARNTGLKAATGDYVTFVDSDDWLGLEMYQKMIESAQDNKDAEVIMCDYLTVKNTITENISTSLRPGSYQKKDIIREIYPTLLVTEDFGKIPVLSTWNCLFKRSLLRANDILFDENLKFCEDYLFMAEVVIRADAFYYMKGNFWYYYRQYGESRSKKYQPEWWHNLLYLNKKLENLLLTSNEYDFCRQLKLQLIHSALFLSSAIISNQLLTQKEKSAWLQKLFNDRELQAAFQNLPFRKQSPTFKIVLYLMKYRQSTLYFAYRRAINHIKVK